MLSGLKDQLLFLYKFMRAPKQIGSVTPSSVFLAKKMLESVPWGQVKNVAELGAGTGAITKQMNNVLQEETQVMLFEKDSFLRGQLITRFPDYTCHEDACMLQSSVQSEGINELDCILSGLPFFNFPEPLREKLIQQIQVSLKPGGLFIAFQYSQQMRKRLNQQFDIERIHFVPLNVPPAFVYVCRKRLP
ncbi:class I SAM-dependent methyltransferase [Paenibacillus alba]|uniref:Methyltransferase n=1 Tax=Paenibacillus alba TaxID=1197127 RepID=A0ABU6G703_9BACL|nr:phospholipid methyltransferase [Paenibacillus alba]MEC0229954.1 methyltransferase [Paenibacillus alba]